MIITIFGISLFLIVERVEFIKIRSPAVSDGFEMSYEADRSRHPE